MVKKIPPIFILILITVSCGIKKRQHLSGWYFPPIQKIQYQEDKANTPKNNKIQTLTLQTLPDNLVEFDSVDTNPTIQLTFKETPSSIGTITEKTIFFSNSIKSNITIEKGTHSSFHTKIFNREKMLKKQKLEKETELSKGAKVFWLTILFTILFATFVVCGALWPEVYIVFFGLTAIIALIGASTGGDPGTFGERIGAFFLFIIIGLFYLWIYLSFPLMWPAIYLQLLVYGAIGLISLLVWGIVKKKEKKSFVQSKMR